MRGCSVCVMVLLVGCSDFTDEGLRSFGGRIAVGGTGTVVFTDDCIRSDVGNCVDETIREFTTIAADPSFEVLGTTLESTRASIRLRALAEGDGEMRVTFLADGSSPHELVLPLEARMPDRATLSAGSCPFASPVVMPPNGELLVRVDLFAGTDRLQYGDLDPLVPTNLIRVSGEEPLHLYRTPATPGTAGLTTTFAPTAALAVEVYDPATLDTITATPAVTTNTASLYFPVDVRLSASRSGVPVCKPPNGPWDVTILTPTVCSLENAAVPPVSTGTVDMVDPKITVHGLERGMCRFSIALRGTSLTTSAEYCNIECP